VEIETDPFEVDGDDEAEGNGPEGDDEQQAPDMSLVVDSVAVPSATATANLLQPLPTIAVPVPVPLPPPAIPLEHTRHGIERDPGAETEVEAEGRARGDTPPVGMIPDLTEPGVMSVADDEDEEMVDVTHTHGSALGFVPGSSVPGAHEREYEGLGSRVGEMDETGGIVVDGEMDLDGTIGGKRKR
jgi:hypothetical protein